MSVQTDLCFYTFMYPSSFVIYKYYIFTVNVFMASLISDRREVISVRNHPSIGTDQPDHLSQSSMISLFYTAKQACLMSNKDRA